MGKRRLNGCGYAAKVILTVVNLVFMAGGVALIGLGAYTAQKEHVSALRPFSVPTALIILGSVVCLMSFLGGFGVARENPCMLKTCSGFQVPQTVHIKYFSILLVVVATQIILGAMAYRYRGHLYEELRDSWEKATVATRNSIETEFKCCGFDSKADVGSFPIMSQSGEDVCIEPRSAPFDSFGDGCFTRIRDEVVHHSLVAEIAGFALASVELVGLVLTWILLAAIAESEWASVQGEDTRLLSGERRPGDHVPDRRATVWEIPTTDGSAQTHLKVESHPDGDGGCRTPLYPSTAYLL